MRHYFMVEVMDGDIYLTEGRGVETEEDFDVSKYWHETKEIKDSNILLTRILELLKKGGCEK